MHILDAGRLNWLLRDLELSAAPAMRRALPQVELHLWLLARLNRTDVRGDAAYQQRLARHIGLRGKLRTRKEHVFDLVETLKGREPPQFDDLLLQVSELTGQVEKSVASSLLALFDPDQPVIDRDLRELLPRYGMIGLAEAPQYDECVAWHRATRLLFAQVLASTRWASISSRIDAALPPAEGAVLTEVRKLNLLLSHARRVVALMPSLEPVLVRRTSAPVPVHPSPIRQGVRLHLCR